MEESSLAIETVTVLPRTQFYYKYQLNNGVFHTIKKDQAFPYLSQFVEKNNLLRLQDLLQRFLPFTIIVSKNKIIELKKKMEDREYYQQTLRRDLQKRLHNPLSKQTKEYMPNDKKVKEMTKKFLK